MGQTKIHKKEVVFALQQSSSARGASLQLRETARTKDNSKKLNDVVYARRFALPNEEAGEGSSESRTRMAESDGAVNLLILLIHLFPLFNLIFSFFFLNLLFIFLKAFKFL